MSDLSTTQRLLWSLITAPEGVGAALAEAQGRGEDLRGELLRTVRDDPRFGAVERVEVYANMYFYRLLDVLRDDFGAVAAVAGEAGFHNLVTDYLLRHFPEHHSLRYAGRFFPEFLVSRESRIPPSLPDLARFEWSLTEAFDAADAAAASADELRAIPAPQWPELRLQLQPSVRLLACRWDVREIWKRVQAGQEPEPGDAADVRYCVWRKDLRVLHRQVDEAEWAGLRALLAGASFVEVCSEIAGRLDGDPENAAPAAASMLMRWTEDGLIRGGQG